METFKDRRLRHARIAALKTSIQLMLKRTMDKQDTLGLESLELEQTKTPRDCSKRRANRRKGWPMSQQNAAQKSFCAVSEQNARSEVIEYRPTAPSSNWLQVPPLGSNTSNLQWGQDISPNAYRNQHHVTGFQPGQGFVPLNKPSNVRSRCQTTPPLRGSSSSRSDGGAPGPFVEKSKLSVSAHLQLPLSCVHKQRRHSSARSFIQTPPLEPSRLKCPLSTNLQQAKSLSSSEPLLRNSKTAKSSLTTRNPQVLNPIRKKDPLIHLPAPVPTSNYLTLAHATPTLLPSPQRLLLVLDLNGTLLDRVPRSQLYTHRPQLHQFLKYAFASDSLLIWSSAQPHNVKYLCERLFKPEQRQLLLGEWARDTLGLTQEQSSQRVQVYKRLDRIWDDVALQYQHPGFDKGARWGQHNTLLIDDSVLKASAQPYNHVEVPEFGKESEKAGDGKNVLGQVVGYLEEARKWNDVSAFVRERRFQIDTGWSWMWKQKKKAKRQGVKDQVEGEDEHLDGEDSDDGGVRL